VAIQEIEVQSVIPQMIALLYNMADLQYHKIAGWYNLIALL
jgi:hypothetical protein